MLTPLRVVGIFQIHIFGAVAQLGERMTGSHEVVGSIPISSTNNVNDLGGSQEPLSYWREPQGADK